MINQTEFLKLYDKYLRGECSPDEGEQLESYQDNITLPDDDWTGDPEEKERIHLLLAARIQQSINFGDIPKIKNKSLIYKIAASVVLVVCAGFGLWRLAVHNKVQKQNDAVAYAAKILPGGNKAYLTMSNGKTITLNNAANGPLETQAGVNINKINNGLLHYDQTSNDPVTKMVYNTLTIPRGGQYQVQLADGTHVWLNSASILRYPTVFKGQERKIELSGEAYFEVAKDASKPFIVHINGVDIRVLGTHFNVMGYPDEQNVQTTLLEGSVKLSNSGYSAVLKPGEQGSLNNTHPGFVVRDVDVEDVMAWKNGFFVFNNENIQTIMSRISRWYDVDILYSEQLKRKNFGGTVSRFTDVSEVLKSLEMTGSVHFKIEGRRIVVMP